MKHLLVTNDFPPKIGGIQSLLWEWWRRLPPDSFAVLTSPYAGAAAFDAEQPFHIERTREPVLLPHPWMVRHIDTMARAVNADLVVLDPALPLGLVGPSLHLPYDVILHGAEVTVPGRLPISKQTLAYVLRRARHVVAGGAYPAREAERAAGRTLPITVIATRRRHRSLSAAVRGGAIGCAFPTSVSLTTPRSWSVSVASCRARVSTPQSARFRCGGAGGRGWFSRSRAADARRRGYVRSRPHSMHRSSFSAGSPTTICPTYMDAPTCTRWCAATGGVGWNRKASASCFFEAAACGVPQVAGDSGGAAEAVDDGHTGIVVRHPDDPRDVAFAFETLLDDPVLARAMGSAARDRAVREFSYDLLAHRLGVALGALTD